MMIPRRTLLGIALLGGAAALSVGLVCTPTTANPGAQARIGGAGARLHADRQQRQAGLARRLQGQDRGARVDQS